MLTKVFLVLTVLLGVLVAPLAAQQAQQDWQIGTAQAENPERMAAASSLNCNAGIVYDDGGFNDGYRIGPDAAAVMEFKLPAGTAGLGQVCTCFSRDEAAPATMGFDVVVYDNDGAGGGPGTLLGTVHSTANGIPVFPATQFYNVNLSGSGISLPDQDVYVGVVWTGAYPPIYICGDRSTATSERATFGSGNGGSSWANMSALFPDSPPRAVGVRVDPLTSDTSCTPSATVMCLNDNRFQVEATFRTSSGGPAVQAQVFKLTNDSGYFWFFNEGNVELLVKVLNACGFSSAPRYWVFAAGLTNVAVTITVTDTENPGLPPRVYSNALGQPFPPLQDTNAFATCP